MRYALGANSAAVVAVLATLAAGPGVAEGAYTVTDLSPTESTGAQAFAVYGGQQAGVSQVDGNPNAYLWSGTSPGTNLQGVVTPAPSGSTILGLSGTQAAGYVVNSGFNRAGVWTLGSPTVFQPLDETGYSDSQATAISGSVIVGSGTGAPGSQALVWTNSAAAPLNLQPPSPDFTTSTAAGTDGNRIVGSVALVDPHAALWHLSGTFFTDLHPTSGFLNSNALGVAGNWVVGYGQQDTSVPDGALHAMLWTLSGVNDETVKFTDIHPAGYTQSFASATNGTLIVGFATEEGVDHALLWDSPTHVMDLSLALPAGQFTASHADGIDAAGDIVGDATDLDGNVRAILWTPAAGVPEPGTVLLLSLPAVGLWRRRRR